MSNNDVYRLGSGADTIEEPSIRWPRGLSGENLVGAGVTAIVARLDAVLKFVDPDERPCLEREALVYERLGNDHDGVVRYFGRMEDGLILQYAHNGSIRQYMTRENKCETLSTRLRWAEQITAAVAFIHSKSVLHGDISCNNVFLDEELNTKLGDFAGSSIDGLAHLTCYETSHQLPGVDNVSVKSEIFALGSTFYEIITGSKPYEGHADDDISNAFARGEFPNLESLDALGGIITTCWTQGYSSVEELLEDVKTEATYSPPLIPHRM